MGVPAQFGRRAEVMPRSRDCRIWRVCLPVAGRLRRARRGTSVAARSPFATATGAIGSPAARTPGRQLRWGPAASAQVGVVLVDAWAVVRELVGFVTHVRVGRVAHEQILEIGGRVGLDDRAPTRNWVM